MSDNVNYYFEQLARQDNSCGDRDKAMSSLLKIRPLSADERAELDAALADLDRKRAAHMAAYIAARSAKKKQPDIAYLIATPIEQLRYKDWSIKSGKDQFSKMDLVTLQSKVTISQYCEIKGLLDETAKRFKAVSTDADFSMTQNMNAEQAAEYYSQDSTLAKCLRWILRGLDPAKAFAKIEHDFSMVRSVAKSKNGDKFYEERMERSIEYMKAKARHELD